MWWVLDKGDLDSFVFVGFKFIFYFREFKVGEFKCFFYRYGDRFWFG